MTRCIQYCALHWPDKMSTMLYPRPLWPLALGENTRRLMTETQVATTSSRFGQINWTINESWICLTSWVHPQLNESHGQHATSASLTAWEHSQILHWRSLENEFRTMGHGIEDQEDKMFDGFAYLGVSLSRGDLSYPIKQWSHFQYLLFLAHTTVYTENTKQDT